MPNETKKCENCDAVIAKDEKVCPACKLDLEELEDRIKEQDTIEKIREKRRAAAGPPEKKDKKRKGLFGSLK